jgi:acetyltransferase-like isoleucine patch superfamily enzyme
MSGFLKFLRALPRSLAIAVIIYLPGEAGILLRRWYYGKRLGRCGKNFTVLPGVHIAGVPYIEVGDDVTIRENAILHAGIPVPGDAREITHVGRYDEGRRRGYIVIKDRARVAFGAILLGYGGISIGEKCGLGPNAVLLSESYHHKGKVAGRIYKYSQGALPQEVCVIQGFIELQDGAGIASNVLVLPGATISKDAWVSPNSLVRLGGYVEPDVIASGNPAVSVFKRTYAVQGANPGGEEGASA